MKMKISAKIAAATVGAALMFAAGSASATVYLLGDLNSSAPLSKSVVDKPSKSGVVSDQFEFTVGPAALLTYGQLEVTLNKQSSVLTGGYIQLEKLVKGTYVPILSPVDTYTPIGAQTGSYTIATNTADLGAGQYLLDVESKDLSKKLGVNYTVGIFGSAVPEPATWAVMLFGFGAIGATMRNARRQQALAA